MVAAAVIGAVVYFNQDTYHDVVLRHANQINAVGSDLRALAAVMPPEGSVKETSCPGVANGEQPFRFDRDDSLVNATEIVMANQLYGPEAEQGRFDPQWASYLASLMKAVAPGYQPTDVDNEWATDSQVRSVESVSNLRYVTIVRVTGITEPRVPLFPLDPVAVSRGSLTVEAVIADLKSQQILCNATTQASMTEYDAVKNYTYVPRETQSYLDGRLRDEARKALGTMLNSLRHGSFDGL